MPEPILPVAEAETAPAAAPTAETDHSESTALEHAGNLMRGLLDDADGTTETAEEPQDETATQEESVDETNAPAEEDEGSEEEQEDQEPSADETQERINKRIGKEVRKRKAAEEQLAQVRGEQQALRAEVEKLKSGQTPAQADSADDETDLVERQADVKALRKEVEKASTVATNAKALLRKLAHEPEEVLEIMAKRGIQLSEVSEAAARSYLEEVIDVFGGEANEKRIKLEVRRSQLGGQVQQMRAEFNAQATEAYPWLKDAKSPLQKQAEEIHQAFKFLQKLPDGVLAVADLVAGRAARLARKNGKGPVNGDKPKPPKLPTSQAPQGRPESKLAAGSIAKNKALESGSEEDVAAFIRAHL
jgi:hypothetical protein